MCKSISFGLERCRALQLLPRKSAFDAQGFPRCVSLTGRLARATRPISVLRRAFGNNTTNPLLKRFRFRSFRHLPSPLFRVDHSNPESRPPPGIVQAIQMPYLHRLAANELLTANCPVRGARIQPRRRQLVDSASYPLCPFVPNTCCLESMNGGSPAYWTTQHKETSAGRPPHLPFPMRVCRRLQKRNNFVTIMIRVDIMTTVGRAPISGFH